MIGELGGGRVALITFVAVAVPALFAAFAGRQSRFVSDRESRIHHYRVGWWMYLITALGGGVGVGFFGLGIVIGGIGSICAYGAIGLVFLVSSVLGWRKLKRAVVEIGPHDVHLRYGSKDWCVNISDIRSVFAVNGMIVVVLENERFVIPMVFSRAAEMLAVLRSRADGVGP